MLQIAFSQTDFINSINNITKRLNHRQKSILHLIFHRITCLSVVLYPEKGAYPENSRVVFCPNKQRSFEPLMCVGGSYLTGGRIDPVAEDGAARGNVN